MAVKIKLQRLGKMREPHYRVVVADARTKRDGRVIETIGQYHPKDEPSTIIIDGERAKYWLSVGATPTEPVTALLKVTGDWQSFKGLPAPAPMRVAAPKADRKAIFEDLAKNGAATEEKLATTTKAAKKDAKVAEVLAAEPEADAPGQVAGAGTSSPAAIVSPAEPVSTEPAAADAATTEA